MVSFICQCCGVTGQFTSAEEAYDTGWDIPPYFTTHVACFLCPGAPIVTGHSRLHSKAHERWAREGRPETFEASYAAGDMSDLDAHIHKELSPEQRKRAAQSIIEKIRAIARLGSRK